MLTLYKFKIGHEFIQTHLSFHALNEIFKDQYDNVLGERELKYQWFINRLVSEGKAERVPSGFEEITWKLGD
jgi:hypothetical protein